MNEDEGVSVRGRSTGAGAGVFVAGGAMGALARELDWSRTALGPVEAWPQSLRTTVSIVLDSKFPMMIAWGPDFIQLYNDPFRPILGATKHPALGKGARETFPEAWHIVGPLFDQVMRGSSVSFEDMLVPLDRHGYLEECFFAYSYSPVRDESGAVGGLLVVVTETSARVVAERRLRTLRELGLRTAQAASEHEAWKAADRVLAESPADLPFALLYAIEHGGRRASLVSDAPSPLGPSVVDLEAPAHWPFEMVRSTQRAQLVEDLRQRSGDHHAPGTSQAVERALVLPVARPGAEPYGFLVAVLSPRRPYDDKYQDFLVLLADQLATSIANARAHEEERRRAEGLLELDRQKMEFFSNASHELRTPLTLLLGALSEVSEAEWSAPEAVREALRVAHRNGARLLRLTNALLDFTRIQAGKHQLSCAPTDAAALTIELVSAFHSAFQQAGLSLEVHAAPQNERVSLDAAMWEKVLFNLLSNAFKHTFSGGVEVRLQLESGALVLSVSDTGVGVPAHELPRLFERFHRVRGARSRSHEGTGIGLSLVRELVTLHGGSVDVQSVEGVGTTFTVTLPCAAGDLTSEPEPARALLRDQASIDAWLPPAQEPAIAETWPLGPAPSAPDAWHVLVADDSADMRRYMRRVLAARFHVAEATDGLGALAALRSRLPDVLVADVMMPGMDGFELIRAVREDPATRLLPVVLVSARAGEEATEEGLQKGADDYVVKPFSARELAARVAAQAILGRARSVEQAARERLRRVLEQAPVAVCVVRGPDFVFELANPRYEAMVGREVPAGRRFREVFHELPDDAPLFAMLRDVRATGSAFTASEYPLTLDRHGDGELEDGFFLLTSHPVREADGSIDTIITVAVDVTEHVRSRQAVERLAKSEEAARKAAEIASRTKDEFLSTLSHELRTPLSAVVGWASLLRQGSVAEPQRARALEAIERNARAQVRLIDDMLDVSRIVLGKMTLSVAPVELAGVVEAALDSVGPAAEAKGVRVQRVLDSRATIIGDADRLQQVVWNLLSNAIKFTRKGGRVQVQLVREHSYVEIVVSDSGQGIDPSFLPYVFDRFRQADGTSTRRIGGLGLGLSIVRSLVELHGGTVAAASEGIDKGSSFSVRLPLAPVRANESVPPLSPPIAAPHVAFEQVPMLRGLRILVVDDEPDTRELLAYLLRACEAQVTLAGQAAQALDLVKRERFDVLVSDVGMPDEDGLALIRKIRQLPASQGGRTPALALTAYARAEDRKAALLAGFQMHASKPIEPGELAVMVASLARTTPLASR